MNRNGKFTERGQAVALFAIMVPLMALFLLVVLDYMVANLRTMEAVAAADLAAHAGAQEVQVLEDGTITGKKEGQQVAASYFNRQRPAHAQFGGAACGRIDGRPACRVKTTTVSPGYLLPRRVISVEAIGYLAYGVTRGDQ